MRDSLKGIDKVLMFRVFNKRKEQKATVLALQTVHTIKEASKVTTKETKDGTLVSGGTLTTTIDIEAIASDDIVNKMLRWVNKERLELEIWEVDFSKPMNPDSSDNTKFLSQYGTGYLTGWDAPANVSDDVTIKTTASIKGKLVSGYATVDHDQLAEYNKFRDTVADPKEEEPLNEDPYAIESGSKDPEEPGTGV